MGHDISTEISKGISFGATSEYKMAFVYGSLQADKYNAGVSGNGESRDYTRNEIEVAYRRFLYMKEEQDIEAMYDSSKLQLSKDLIARLFGKLVGANTKLIDATPQRIDAINEVDHFYKDLLSKDFKTVTIGFY